MTDTETGLALGDLVSLDDLAAAIEAGHITRRQHPTLPLSILTYTRTCQYGRHWNPATIACRGLIVEDDTNKVIAWPFPKFFGVLEHDLGHDYAPPLPDGEPFEVYDKVDGSLGIVFWYAGRWRVASKGSFVSEQAKWAQAWVDDHDTAWLIPGTTYLAEIVYPENRIVVDYHGRRDLVLLAAYDITGRELRLPYVTDDWKPIGTVVKTWGKLPLPKLVELAAANQTPDGRPASGMDAEGYVIRFTESGIRAKAKLSEYVRLHKVLTGITERDIWRMLGTRKFADQPAKQVAKSLGCPVSELGALGRGRDPLDALLETVPDEFDAWVRSVAARLEEQVAVLGERAAEEYAAIAHLAGDRGEFARAVQRIDGQAMRACMFLMLDGRPTGLHLWRAIKPEASAPFVADDET
ncbi:T4 RnlA family RNA ligase [Streptomyces sp. NPDC091412]|uniref:T4 RnlA family RNA ligase n=1 Tax=Streptomyces sp. NPDC091412 TaxID=3366002 RepID=UPI0037F798B3